MWQIYAQLARDIMDERQREADARLRAGRPVFKARPHPGSTPRHRLGRAAGRAAER
ncbi:MAG: hypothetical protein H0T04_04985 [Chloroflexi bacterium]|nr:hypothetical protein [Chloroflexota bacterium]MBA3850970.1 hypothetical protein [Chloroflexota bacterium]